MAREFIPTAIEESVRNPGLEIKANIGQSVPSESGESTHSMALTSLSRMGLPEGIPVAEKIADKKFNYRDANGKLIPKAEALKIADGVVYYQDPTLPTKGRLRHNGSFVGVDDARTIVSGSRASNCSDVANHRDLDDMLRQVSGSRVSNSSDVANHRDLDDMLPTVPEEPPVVDGREPPKPQFGKSILVSLLWMMVVALLLFTCMHFTLGSDSINSNMKLLAPPHTELPRSFAKHDMIDHVGSVGLSKSLAELLAKEEMGASEDQGELGQLLLDGPYRTTGDKPSEQKALAKAEVERILTTIRVGEILGDGTRAEQWQAFVRIARLLHPDKGHVSSGDPRAALALRLAFAARRKLSMG